MPHVRRWLVRQLATGSQVSRRAKLIISLLLFGLAFAVRSLHAVDLESVMYTTNQPFGGLTVLYDARATDIVGGGGLLGPYGKPWQTQAYGLKPFMRNSLTIRWENWL